MTAALPRPPPLPFQREEWLAEAFAAVDALGPPRSEEVLALDATPCVVLTATGGGRSRTWVLYEPFRVERSERRPRRPGAPFVVLTARGGGVSRTWVLFEPFRVRPVRRVEAAPPPAPAPAPVHLPAPPESRPQRDAAPRGPAARPRRSRRHARPAGTREPQWHQRAAQARLEAVAAAAAASPAPPPSTSPPALSSAGPLELRALAPALSVDGPPVQPAPPEVDWPWPPCPLAPVDEHAPELRPAAISEHRLWDLSGGRPGPRAPPERPPLPSQGPTCWPPRRGEGRTYSEMWFELHARAAGERQEQLEATRAAREAGFLVRRSLGPSGPEYVAELEDLELRQMMHGGEPVLVRAATVDALRAQLRPYWRALLRLGRPARLPRRSRPRKPPPPEQLALALDLPAPRARRATP